MAWTTPRTWVVGEVVTKAMLDEQIKANEDYLKAETDKLYIATQEDMTALRALNTVYQNTSGKLRSATITCSVITGAPSWGSVIMYCGTTSPPTVKVGEVSLYGTTLEYHGSVHLIIPNNYYCNATTVSGDGNTLKAWVECDLH